MSVPKIVSIVYLHSEIEFLLFKIQLKYFSEEAIMAMELQAFDQCESDGVTGLSWKEVEDCEEKFCSLLAIGKEQFMLNIGCFLYLIRQILA